MKKTFFLSLILISVQSFCFGQTISGKFTYHKDQKIELLGFTGLENYTIDKTKIDDSGEFKLSYSNKDVGAGFLVIKDNSFLVLLSGENIVLHGETLSQKESVDILEGQENIWFGKYATEHPKREQALSAWIYLEKMYNQDSLFSIQKKPKESIQAEKRRIKEEDSTFIAELPEESYVKWFLPTRKLVSSVSVVAQHRTEEIPATIQAFRELDYTDERLYKSGLFKDAIESHFWLLENSGRPLEKVFEEMKVSIDAMLEKLVMDEDKLNEVTDYLFDLLERHSLFQASEYLALRVLSEEGCTVDDDLAKQLETYRAMKKGNTAPDIKFKADIISPNFSDKDFPKKLSDINSKYKVIVFGASWCPKCTEELPEIAKSYSKWQENGVEVVFVSLDENKNAFQDFASGFPFLSICDYKKWDSPIVNDYYVFGTPTMYLLDENREILLRPKSVKQMDAWVDWFLVEGNLMPK